MHICAHIKISQFAVFFFASVARTTSMLLSKELHSFRSAQKWKTGDCNKGEKQ
jgi:hypothetical protein